MVDRTESDGAAPAHPTPDGSGPPATAVQPSWLRDADPASLSDGDLAKRWATRDRAAFAEAYRRFAPALFGTAVGLLGDHAAAADVVHDAFVRAAPRVGSLRNPDRLRAWLFAILRNEATSVHRSRRHDGGPLDDADGSVTDRLASDAPPVDVEVSRVELESLVWTAADGLQPRDREVLELSVRGGLETADLADALGVSAGHAAVLLSRMRTRLERCLGALLVARLGRRDCDELDRLLASWDGRFSLDVRSRVSRHVEGCARCGERRTALVSMERLAPALVPPVVLLPDDLRARLVASLARGGAAAAPVVGTAWGWHADGFPEQAPSPVERLDVATPGGPEMVESPDGAVGWQDGPEPDAAGSDDTDSDRDPDDSGPDDGGSDDGGSDDGGSDDGGSDDGGSDEPETSDVDAGPVGAADPSVAAVSDRTAVLTADGGDAGIPPGVLSPIGGVPSQPTGPGDHRRPDRRRVSAGAALLAVALLVGVGGIVAVSGIFAGGRDVDAASVAKVPPSGGASGTGGSLASPSVTASTSGASATTAGPVTTTAVTSSPGTLTTTSPSQAGSSTRPATSTTTSTTTTTTTTTTTAPPPTPPVITSTSLSPAVLEVAAAARACSPLRATVTVDVRASGAVTGRASWSPDGTISNTKSVNLTVTGNRLEGQIGPFTKAMSATVVVRVTDAFGQVDRSSAPVTVKACIQIS